MVLVRCGLQLLQSGTRGEDHDSLTEARLPLVYLQSKRTARDVASDLHPSCPELSVWPGDIVLRIARRLQQHDYHWSH